MQSTYCLTISRAVSGDVPADLEPPYRAPDLYPIAGATNFTAVAEDGLASCNATAIFENSLVGPTGPILEQVVAAYTEACPDTLAPATGPLPGVLSPQDALEYECSEACVEWLINFGVCISTDLKAVCPRLVKNPAEFWQACIAALKYASGWA